MTELCNFGVSLAFWAALELIAFGLVYGAMALIPRRPCKTCGRLAS